MKNFKSTLIALAVAAAMPFTAAQAATRAELYEIKAPANGDFQYWNSDSQAKKKLVDFVKGAVAEGSDTFIPVEDRVAVFDLDGTIYCETAPTYFGWVMYFDRFLANPANNPSFKERELASYIKAEWEKGNSGAVNAQQNAALVRATAGMTQQEFDSYIQPVLDKPVEGLTNLTYGSAFYLPMLEVISYLQQNDFQVYMVSASEREILRALCKGVLHLPVSSLIASDITYSVKGVDITKDTDYVFDDDDQVVMGDKFLGENGGITKVMTIQRAIGVQPVLAFGNSSGDYSMFNYAMANKKYHGQAFALLCDDTERENGNLKKAEKVKQTADKYGWTPVSMKNDFKTIYGDNVKKVPAL